MFSVRFQFLTQHTLRGYEYVVLISRFLKEVIEYLFAAVKISGGTYDYSFPTVQSDYDFTYSTIPGQVFSQEYSRIRIRDYSPASFHSQLFPVARLGDHGSTEF